MGGVNRTFEVTRNKKVVWECFHYYFNKGNNVWLPYSNYRNNFSSSLFPQYFTVESLSGIKQIKAGKTFKDLKVNNEGTENDVYTVEMISDEKTLIASKTTLTVKARSSTPINLKMPSQLNDNQLIIKIYPTVNPSIARSIIYDIIK